MSVHTSHAHPLNKRSPGYCRLCHGFLPDDVHGDWPPPDSPGGRFCCRGRSPSPCQSRHRCRQPVWPRARHHYLRPPRLPAWRTQQGTYTCTLAWTAYTHKRTHRTGLYCNRSTRVERPTAPTTRCSSRSETLLSRSATLPRRDRYFICRSPSSCSFSSFICSLSCVCSFFSRFSSVFSSTRSFPSRPRPSTAITLPVLPPTTPQSVRSPAWTVAVEVLPTPGCNYRIEVCKTVQHCPSICHRSVEKLFLSVLSIKHIHLVLHPLQREQNAANNWARGGAQALAPELPRAMRLPCRKGGTIG